MSGSPHHGHPGRLGLAEARARAAAAAPRSGAEDVPLVAALGRVLAAPLTTPIPLPHYASSAMDGWAVRGAPPWRIIDRIDGELSPGEAVVIVTGALVPAEADAVLRAEAGRVAGGPAGSTLLPVGEVGAADVAGRRHIRPAGTEAGAGAVLLEAGALLTPPRIALAAATGADHLLVRRRPRVAVVLTGDEVVGSGVPAPGQVRDSFSIAVPAILAGLGAEVAAVHRVGDEIGTTRSAITADDVELVVTTGGTGGSHADHVRAAVESLGAEFLVPSLATRPGGPTFLARAPGRLVLGLPGNPHAAMLGLLGLGGPLFAAWLGHDPLPMRRVVAAAPLEGRHGVTRLVPAVVRDGAATPAEHAGPGMLRGLAAADVVLVIPDEGAAAGASVEAIPLPWAH